MNKTTKGELASVLNGEPKRQATLSGERRQTSLLNITERKKMSVDDEVKTTRTQLKSAGIHDSDGELEGAH